MSTAATGARRLLRFLRPRPGHASLYLLLAIVVLGFVAYSPSLSKEFLDYDDDWYITANPYVQGFDRATLLDFFGRTYRGQYSPLPMLLEGIKFSVSGGDPLLFNLSSILIHLLNTCLVFCLTRLLFERRAVAVVVAALFAVHPLQVESIAWLSASMKTAPLPGTASVTYSFVASSLRRTPRCI